MGSKDIDENKDLIDLNKEQNLRWDPVLAALLLL
jgi:hypothetical protein